MNIPTPTVHMNGTSGKSLYADYENAMDKVRSAVDALNAATLNGRDYYPQGMDAFDVARDHRIAMREKLASVYEDLGSIAMGIHDQLRR